MAFYDSARRIMMKRSGVHNDLPRFERLSDGAEVYGYLRTAESITNPFLIENIRLGAACADHALASGDLLLDRSTNRTFFVLSLQPRYLSGMVIGYEFKAYLTTSIFSVKRLFEGPRNPFSREPDPSTYQTVMHNVYAQVFNERFWVERESYSQEDVSQYLIYHNFVSIRQGDVLVESDGTSYLAKISDHSIFDGTLVRTAAVKGSGG